MKGQNFTNRIPGKKNDLAKHFPAHQMTSENDARFSQKYEIQKKPKQQYC